MRRGHGNEAWLWIEARQAGSIYDAQLSPGVFQGALIHYQDAATGSATHLLDYTPATTSFKDGVLRVGQTWNDPYSNLSLTVNSVSATGLTVSVSYGALACTRARPSVSISPASLSTRYGSNTSVSVSVRNNSSAGCAAERFDLGATVPASWTRSFTSDSLTLAPGQAALTLLNLGVPNPYALGTYAVSAKATSAQSALSGASTMNTSITAPR